MLSALLNLESVLDSYNRTADKAESFGQGKEPEPGGLQKYIDWEFEDPRQLQDGTWQATARCRNPESRINTWTRVGYGANPIEAKTELYQRIDKAIAANPEAKPKEKDPMPLPNPPSCKHW